MQAPPNLPPNLPPHPQDWLRSVLPRFTAQRFTIREDVMYGNAAFPVVAHRSEFEVAKFGNSDTFFVFAFLDQLDVATMRRFSTDAFNFATQCRSGKLPVGFFESVWSFAVAITPTLDPATSDAIRTQELPKHWSAGEFPVVYEAAKQNLCYYEKTPMWGAAYYAGFRKQVRDLLG